MATSKKDDEKAPEQDYAPSGRSSEEAAAQIGSQSGRVTGDPKPPERPDPIQPPEGHLNPAGAPLLPHPGVSTPEQAEMPAADADLGDDETDDAEDEGDDKAAGKSAKPKKAPLNANDLKVSDAPNNTINAPHA